MDRATGATAPVPTTTVNDGKQTIASVMPFSSADKMGPFKDWKAEVILGCACLAWRVMCLCPACREVRKSLVVVRCG